MIAASDRPWQLWCDGTAWPNPGRLGLGVVLLTPDRQRQTFSVKQEHGCNNEAELQALLLGLRSAHDLGARRIAVFSDSDFVVRHVRDGLETKPTRLRALLDEAARVLEGFDQIELTWIPRHRNGEADTLARAALGLAAKPVSRPVSRKRRR